MSTSVRCVYTYGVRRLRNAVIRRLHMDVDVMNGRLAADPSIRWSFGERSPLTLIVPSRMGIKEKIAVCEPMGARKVRRSTELVQSRQESAESIEGVKLEPN